MSSTSSSAPIGRRARAIALLALAAALLSALLSTNVRAVLTIEVTRGSEAAIPIAIVPFAQDGAPLSESAPADVITADLRRSGRFAPLARDDFISRPHDMDAVQYKNWRLLKAEALVIGRIARMDDGRYEIRFRLLDVFRERQLVGQRFVVPAAQLRKAAHQISDLIHQKLTGKPGAFDTRIAYITVEPSATDAKRKRYLLQVADSDGYDAKTILESPQPILSPAWSPDGNRLAYVSFEKKRSMIYVQNLWSGARELVASHDGINGAPAWSPDGTRLAMALSRDGNANIYIHDLGNGELRRLTSHFAIDTEPAWSPDGDAIVFTSDRTGTPQIYRIPAAGGDTERLTRSGKYNAGAQYSPDGNHLALVTNQGDGYRVGLYSMANRSITELTRTTQDESPTFAPNGEMLMYATQVGASNVLAAVSTDGRVHHILRLQSGAVREPAWSPYNRKL